MLTPLRSPRLRLVLPTKQDRTTNLRRSLLRIRRSPRIPNIVSELVRSHRPKRLTTDRPLSHYKSWRITLFLPWERPPNDRRLHHARNRSLQHLEPRNPNREHCASPLGASNLLWSSVLYISPYPLLHPLALAAAPGRILTTFIGADLLIELMVANGAAKAANTSTGAAEQQAGGILIKTALILQACTFAAYVTILAIWHTRAKRAGLMTGNLRKIVAVMYASAALISARCIYRIAEYFEGWTGEL